jgi:sarcosine oxidase
MEVRMKDFDVVVIGLGTHGSAVAAHCARKGLTVFGIDRASPPHTEGSHHGESRIIRKAYYEDAAYVPLLERAYVLWDALAAEVGAVLIRRTGGLMIGPPDGELVPGALHSAREHGLPHEWLNADALSSRFGRFTVDPGMEAVYEPDAGVLHPERCVQAHLDVAAAAGAVLQLHRDARVVDRSEAGVVVELTAGDADPERVRARHCVVAVGAGLVDLSLALSPAIEVERQVVAHFAPVPGAAGLDCLPIFAIEESDASFFYGFPDLGSGVKVARHHGGVVSGRNVIDTRVNAADIDQLRGFLAKRLPGTNGPLMASAVCRYANIRDGHFAIDRRDPHLTIVSACSGHGFKFAPVIGELVASIVEGRRIPYDISLFDPVRLG